MSCSRYNNIIVQVEPINPSTDDLIRKNKRKNDYLLDDDLINNDLIQ
jgi:hypothetical protein